MNETVLIVEDTKDTIELLRYNLHKEGYSTVTAQNGEEAIIALQTHNLDLILLDIMLPGLNGWETCEALRSKGMTIPIIMLTALSTKEEQIKGLTIGADDYLSKPFSVKELMLRVKRLLEKEKTIKTLKRKEKEGHDSLQYLVHELKNSLTTVGGFSKLAMENGDNGKYLYYVNSSANHMDSLLNDAFLLSKLEKGDGLFPLENVDISEQLNWAINTVSANTVSKEIDIHLINDQPCVVGGNTVAIRQVLINLLSNAVKYNRKNGNIWIYTNNISNGIEVSVKDTGYGIFEDELPKIFEKFFRAKGSERAQGTGLGLYIVGLLMDAMGGSISVKSKEGVGSTFTVSFRKAQL
ncbi:MAG: hybrid sensor histidine kinase/response regulator [Deltaproteobacteria bacterium]